MKNERTTTEKIHNMNTRPSLAELLEKRAELDRTLASKLKKSILQEAIEGRLVPQDPNDEPASVLLDKIRKEKARLVKEGKLKKKDLVETPISEDEKPFEIPESWEWCRLGDVIEFINGRAYKRDELLDRGKYKVLRVGNFFTNDSWYYSDMELPDEKYCYPGDLLYAWSASFGPKIWKGEKTIFHYHIWNVKFSPIILWREYLYYFFLADKSRIKQSTTGSTMIHVSMENMKPRLIPLPPLAEQKRIVEKIEQLMGEIDKLKA
ncbi:MAG: restriction endonuclease subunit S [Prevotella sp.]|nr:restriction endonuclease subunit S [Prevotella sp.]